MTEPIPTVGIATTDERLVVRTWDAALERMTGIASDTVQGQSLSRFVPNLEQRGLLTRFEQTLAHGTVQTLAPTLHHYLIACPPQTHSRHFERMQQRVIIAPLYENDQISGTIITIEDVTERRERERELADALACDDEMTRLRAAQTLAEESDMPASMLTVALDDTSVYVRRAAVGGIARHADAATITTLVRTLRDDHRNPSTLNSVLQVFGLTNADVTAPLIDLLQSSDADLRGYVTLALGERHDSHAIPALRAALRDPDVNVRYHAIEALGKLQASAAVDDLAPIAVDSDAFLAFAAITALAAIGDPAVVPSIMPQLGDPFLRDAVIELLARLGDAHAVPPLVETLNTPDAPTLAIAHALAALYDRYETFGAGELIADATRRALTESGVQRLLEARLNIVADGSQPLEIERQGVNSDDVARAPALVLSWLGPETDHALVSLLSVPSVRDMVIEALVRRGARVVELLIDQLAALDEQTRQAAAIGLGRIGDRRAVPALIGLLHDQPEVAVVAAGALANIGDRRPFEALLSMLGVSDAAVRQAAVGALNSIGHPAMEERIAQLLHDADPHVRESAAQIAGYFGYATCRDALLECCRDTDERVRRAAIAQLPFFDGPQMLPALRAAFDDRSSGVRAAAARALAHVDAIDALPLLYAALDDGDSWVRYYAAQTLGRHGRSESIGALAKIATIDPAIPVRLTALEGLGQIGGSEAVAVLKTFLTADDDLSQVGLHALGRSAHPDAEAPLLTALRSPRMMRRRAAITALRHYRSLEVIDALHQVAIHEPDPQTTRTAIAILGQIATPEAIAALCTITAEPTRRAPAIAALAQLDDNTIDTVAHGLAHENALVRQAVVEALAWMKRPRASVWIVQALEDQDVAVRQTAATALERIGRLSKQATDS
jgi:HEAT repeat protein